ncbi:response regulator [Desulfofundulus thermobenzoicus]|uniref:Stage 0 sporulation protein A homolog n=1 Tax=Desulfofundulus thermobenzoicus TaxID=29376 RepID=A0A6N7IR80_9FIRM|nr:response regulator transcription factor [Desulfofundulus thermobenzoicus]MQL52542.1 response regulator [Desulfofundulus thermobenzoicus]HHW44024.1 response regulator transcription factor [Desulfotomaculum sp.]
MEPIKTLIADDHALIREGLRKVLSLEPRIQVVGEAANGPQTVEMTLHQDVDIVLLDINLPIINGIEVCRRIKEEKPDIGIIALTIHDQEDYVFEMIRNGASAYLLKDINPEQLIRTIIGVANGESFISPRLMSRVFAEFNRLSTPEGAGRRDGRSLTSRELQVLRLVARGESNRGIAEKLFISEKTVKNHMYSIFRKLGVTDRTQAALYAIKNKIVQL